MTIKKIQRKEVLSRGITLPRWNGKKQVYDYIPNCIAGSQAFSVASRSARGHVSTLILGVEQLAKWTNTSEWYFMPEKKMPWVLHAPAYPPEVRAVDYFDHQKIGKRFDGALQVPLNELRQFIPHYFWLSRTQWFERFWFTDNRNIMGWICRHGGLHIEYLSQEALENVEPLFSKLGFHLVTDCYTPWTGTSRVPGRRLFV